MSDLVRPALASAPADTAAGTPVADDDRTAAHVAWDIEPLLDGADLDALVDRAEAVTAQIVTSRGQLAALDDVGLAALLRRFEELEDLLGRAGNYASLRFATDTVDPQNGARLARFEERSTALWTQLLFFDLEWAALDDAHVDALLASPALAFAAHFLRAKQWSYGMRHSRALRRSARSW